MEEAEEEQEEDLDAHEDDARERQAGGHAQEEREGHGAREAREEPHRPPFHVREHRCPSFHEPQQEPSVECGEKNAEEEGKNDHGWWRLWEDRNGLEL